MPTASPELRDEWHDEGDIGSIRFLEQAGYVLGRDWQWRHPMNKTPTEREGRAMSYLIEEWDFGQFTTTPPQENNND